jgi:outer membrane immunogenic protein
VIAIRIISLLFLPALVLAQTPSTPTDSGPPAPVPSHHYDPVPAARAPMIAGKAMRVKASVGYAYTSLAMSSSNRVNLSGADATLTADLSPHFGVTADSSYERASNVFNTGRHADVLSYLAGPVFYPTRSERLTTYVHSLVGGARVTGPIPTNGGSFSAGYVNKLSWAFGGGIEYLLSRSIAVRIGGDYQHTYFFNSDVAIRGQNNLRAVCSVVYSLWQHPERRR